MGSPFISPTDQRVLLLATNHVGNNIFCTPAARYLKRNFPTLTFDVLCTSRRGADAFRGNPDLSQIHLAFTKRGIRRIASSYDFVIGMYPGMSTRNLRGLTVPHAIIDPKPSLHRADQRLEFVRSLTGKPIIPDDRRYTIQWDPADEDTISQALGATRVGDYRVGLHLGCGRTSVHGWKFWYRGRDQDPKLWSLQNYIDLALNLRSREPRVQLVITGSPNERFLARKFLAAVPGTINLVGKTSVRSVAALMSRLCLFITQDTGILHVACATNVPIIGLFGPTDVQATGPYPLQSRHTIIKRPTMADITPDEVCSIAIDILAGATGARTLEPDPIRITQEPASTERVRFSA